MTAIALPRQPYFGTLDVGPGGELYSFGADNLSPDFVLNRSTNVQNRLVTPSADLTSIVSLGGPILNGLPNLNPAGLLGQAWVAVDRSTGSTRGNVYVLCTVSNSPGNLANVMFSRSTDRGLSWSTPLRLNDDSANQGACHWFGTLAIAPNGRVDACWNDTRNSPDNSLSELYYSWSDDGGLTWAPNRPLSPPFNQALGFPQQNKMGDYIAMVSLNDAACIAYTATFNGEEDIYFVRAELPITASVALLGNTVRISWNGVPRGNYCIQAKADLTLPWSSAYVACIVSTNSTPSVEDALTANGAKFYRVVRTP
jgi:hypothetical protein